MQRFRGERVENNIVTSLKDLDPFRNEYSEWKKKMSRIPVQDNSERKNEQN